MSSMIKPQDKNKNLFFGMKKHDYEVLLKELRKEQICLIKKLNNEEKNTLLKLWEEHFNEFYDKTTKEA